jgi:hypothetical protein
MLCIWRCAAVVDGSTFPMREAWVDSLWTDVVAAVEKG